MKYERVQMPSGLVIGYEYLDSGEKIRESHGYGAMIGITWAVVDGRRGDEVYVFKGKVVSASIYERERKNFPDLPAAGGGNDVMAELKGAVKEGHLRWIKEFKAHVTDSQVGRAVDLRLSEMVRSGLQISCLSDFASLGAKLGENGKSASTKLIQKFLDSGAKAIFLVDRDLRAASFDAAIVELSDSASRSSCFILADLCVRKRGYSGDFDDGQKYLYVRFS